MTNNERERQYQEWLDSKSEAWRIENAKCAPLLFAIWQTVQQQKAKRKAAETV